jgi:hypothetical protein
LASDGFEACSYRAGRRKTEIKNRNKATGKREHWGVEKEIAENKKGKG